MRRSSYKKYLSLIALLFLLVSLPLVFVEGVRLRVIGMFSFFGKGVSRCGSKEVSEAARLEGENHLLRIEIGKLRALIEQQTKVSELSHELGLYSASSRRYDEIQFLRGVLSQVIPARVIFRDPGSFSTSFWISVGEETNQICHQQVVQKNSPVIVGRSIVGAIDYVGKKQSRVRLITDMALKPSVRAVRGHPQNIALVESIDPLLRHLNVRQDLPLLQEEQGYLVRLLEKLKTNINQDAEVWYLAKGILQGSATPMWRSANYRLRGIGFNYDFPDAEGPARELVSGKPINANKNVPTLPIIRENDLLVTTGMDGIFPQGLLAAEVTKIYALKEGGFTYEIEASPIVGNLDALQTVFVIPPLGYDPDDH